MIDTKDKSNDLTITISSTQKNSPISPPTPITPSSCSFTSNKTPNASMYSLFDSYSSSTSSASSPLSPWDWLPVNSAPLLRKHSVDVDGKDFPTATSIIGSKTVNSSTADYWRRASAPNVMSYADNTCTYCLNKNVQLISPSCGQHHFCHSCLTSQTTQLLLQGTCPLCVQTSGSNMDHENNARQIIATPFISNGTTNIFINDNDYSNLRNYANTTNATNHYACVKLTNIPWDISQNDVRHFFGNCRSPSISVCTQSVHIMMDRTTGKTLSDAYVEFLSVTDMRRAIETRNQKPLKGRIVSVAECSQEELLTVVFPKWRGKFQGTSAIPPATEVVRSMSTAAGGGSSGCPPFITREEINSLLVVCKNYKLHFSRKCAERPFENIISVIAKYPWHQAHLISTMHRDHIYEMLKLSMESLKTHLAKDYVQIDPTLLERLVRAGIMCPAFTERQKMTLLQTARMECPQDILPYLIPTSSPNPTSIVTPKTGGLNHLQYSSPNSPILLTTSSQQQYMHNTSTYQQKSSSYSTASWDKNQSTFDNDPFISPTNSPISSLIRDIQQNCYFDEKKLANATTKPSPAPFVQKGIPLLLQPISKLHQPSLQQKSILRQQQQPLSPWAQSYAPNKAASDIWGIAAPAVESNATSNSLLTA